MQRYCPCGKMVAGRRYLCDECSAIYGTKSGRWPRWLRFQVADMKREYDYECECCEREDQYIDTRRQGLISDITGKQI